MLEAYVLIALRYIAYFAAASALVYGFWNEKKVVEWEEKIKKMGRQGNAKRQKKSRFPTAIGKAA
ncbi:MAG: hypothetical protein ACLRZU_12360 [Acutalibacteraceae bacterium]